MVFSCLLLKQLVTSEALMLMSANDTADSY